MNVTFVRSRTSRDAPSRSASSIASDQSASATSNSPASATTTKPSSGRTSIASKPSSPVSEPWYPSSAGSEPGLGSALGPGEGAVVETHLRAHVVQHAHDRQRLLQWQQRTLQQTGPQAPVHL